MSDIDITHLLEREDCIYPTQTFLSDILYDLARQAYSCLDCTPEGTPGRGFYVWTGPPEMSCCDEVVTWVQRLQTYNTKFSPEVFNEPVYNCDERGWAAEVVITLMRPCRRVLDNSGNPSDAKSRNQYGRNLMIDIETMTACVQQALFSGSLAGRNEGYWAERHWFRPTWHEDGAHCTRINLPLVIDLGELCSTDFN